MARWASALLLLSAFFVVAYAGESLAANPRPPLIVVSLDGFRADYFDRGLTPTLASLAASGVHARSMRPSFPSVTDPNHYTLMTGLYPDHHGIVDNTMVDPSLPGMAFGGPHTAGTDSDPRWWNEATPLWVSAERRGLKTATSLWPGDEAVVQGVPASYRQDGAGSHTSAPTMDQQVDTVLDWLDLPAGQRPALIRLHFGAVDTAGHLSGPDSPSVNAAIARVDTELARLVAGLKARGLYDRVNLVVVSDHGMANISKATIIYLDDLIDLKSVVVTTYGAEGGVNPLPGHEAEIEKVLLTPHPHMQCWRRGDIPARLHYGRNPRVPAIFCLADVGWTVITREAASYYPLLHGNHGYDPAEPTMAAFFLAHGPAFKAGVTLPSFDNVDVYPMLATLIGVRPEPNDGHPSDLAAGLVSGR